MRWQSHSPNASFMATLYMCTQTRLLPQPPCPRPLVTSPMVPPWLGGVATGPSSLPVPRARPLPTHGDKSPHSYLGDAQSAAAPRSRIWRSPLFPSAAHWQRRRPGGKDRHPLINSSCWPQSESITHCCATPSPKARWFGAGIRFGGQARPPQSSSRPGFGVLSTPLFHITYAMHTCYAASSPSPSLSPL
jgi:hypothetical protein